MDWRATFAGKDQLAPRILPLFPSRCSLFYLLRLMGAQDLEQIGIEPERPLAGSGFGGLKNKHAPRIGVVAGLRAAQLLNDADGAALEVDRIPGQASVNRSMRRYGRSSKHWSCRPVSARRC
jgi:hypothetical protein